MNPIPGGTAALKDIPLITMVEPMPGFPSRSDFALVRLDDTGILCALSSVDEPGLRFLVVPPGVFFDDYTPEVDQQVIDLLAAESTAEILVLTVVTPGERAQEATVNLMAPVLINLANRRACQVILDADLPVRAPLVA